jgi:hypothetical protein
MKELRSSHFGLGNDKPTTKSVASSQFVRRPASANPKMDAGVKEACERIKKHSFNFGTTNFTPIPQYKSDFTGAKGTKVEEPEAKKNLRKHNFAFGNDRVDYSTT